MAKKESLQQRTATAIKQARKKAGLTQQQLADKMEIDRVQMSLWESGNENIGLVSLEKIAKAMSVSVEVLFK